ncbi:toll/interleukin-1 receptor domain-containing protein [Actinokineospora guangxiensis]|uniref:Toll/interleukin-1 receptor domain-containing protein n=1 Tax=Actinokineospora guangxiensis TaxID=1490288 RepID=A0ABW0EPL4_9PSEU
MEGVRHQQGAVRTLIAELGPLHVFVCHAAPDREAAVRLRADLAQVGRQVALDRGEPNGAQWWDTVLARLRRCSVFVLLLSPESARSPGCMAELRYAAALGKPLAVVRLRAVPVPGELAGAAVIDLTGGTAERVPRLRQLLDTFPAAGPLPQPLPPEPPVPYLDVFRQQIDEPVLDQRTQLSITAELRGRLSDPAQRAGAWALLVRMRNRQDIAAPVAAVLEVVLAPAWQPDPERRVERRYWDGQAWTTLVRHEGREFNERRVPPPEATWSGDVPSAAPPPRQPRARKRTSREGSRQWVVLGVAVALVLAAGVVFAFLLPALTAADDDPVKTARTFVDAVNVGDAAAVEAVTCERDRPQAEELFLAPDYRLTLERVTDSEPQSLTVLATDPRSGVTARRIYPLVRESGQWLVCAR